MTIASVKIGDNLYLLDESGDVYEQLPGDEQFFMYPMRSKVCKKLLYKTINTLKARTLLHKEEVTRLQEQLEEAQLNLRKKAREVRLTKTIMCTKCLEKGKEVRETL